MLVRSPPVTVSFGGGKGREGAISLSFLAQSSPWFLCMVWYSRLRLAAESERMGSQTLENLRLQRETLEHGSAKVLFPCFFFDGGDFHSGVLNVFLMLSVCCVQLDEVNASMDVGDRYLRTMARRLVTNKITLVLIILALLLCVGLLIYFKVR